MTANQRPKSVGRLPLLLALLLLPACAGPLKREFYIRSVDTGGVERRCLVEVNNKFAEAIQNKQYSPMTIEVTFENPEDAVPIRLHYLQVDEKGEVVRVPTQRERTEYKRATRRLHADDAKNQLIILVWNPGS